MICPTTLPLHQTTTGCCFLEDESATRDEVTAVIIKLTFGGTLYMTFRYRQPSVTITVTLLCSNTW